VDDGPDAAEVLADHRDELLALAGVVGVGVGQGPTGSETIVAFLLDASAAKRLPRELDGVPVQGVVTGEVDALPEQR
jgi:hypothetical protein